MDTLEQSVERAWLKSIGLDRWNMAYSSSVAIDHEYSSMAEYMLPRISTVAEALSRRFYA